MMLKTRRMQGTERSEVFAKQVIFYVYRPFFLNFLFLFVGNKRDPRTVPAEDGIP